MIGTPCAWYGLCCCVSLLACVCGVMWLLFPRAELSAVSFWACCQDGSEHVVCCVHLIRLHCAQAFTDTQRIVIVEHQSQTHNVLTWPWPCDLTSTILHLYTVTASISTLYLSISIPKPNCIDCCLHNTMLTPISGSQVTPI